MVRYTRSQTKEKRIKKELYGPPLGCYCLYNTRSLCVHPAGPMGPTATGTSASEAGDDDCDNTSWVYVSQMFLRVMDEGVHTS